jgi:hypothetical protein
MASQERADFIRMKLCIALALIGLEAEDILPLRDCNILLFGVLSDLSVLVLLGRKFGQTV